MQDFISIKINPNSKNIRREEQWEIQGISRCEIVQKVKYMGVDLTNKNIDLLKNNYEKLGKKINEDLLKWNQLNLSLLGRIATIKMNILPRMLFLFQTIPIIMKRQYFLYWKKAITNFIWAGEKTRIKYKILCDARERGGFQLPNLELYYDACCLVWLKEWITLEDKKIISPGRI